MLILERLVDERVVMELPDGGRITVKLKKVGNERAKIGIEAPKNVTILREELEWHSSELVDV